MKIEILDEAENDILNGVRFYEAQSKNLGTYFSDSILSDIDSLYLYAAIHVKINGYYRLLSKRFPFAIYYKQKEDIVYIYAVLDCRQNPSKTQKRL
ncbi:MAG: type II toxin-antitoxin system RelE/ParE family toxin [Sulfurimonas sp.]|uniref:type II toxin-antitoxin system RelE/ParE family toxin n=1 Tax=Sulfurimonas sp. TaxID=2022749 RepID=UPI0028CCCFFD|nr:type II toxin-antitoxin system RelE/ParE family toxin [Sulfurimonas sp.]MDT8339329.1 type II toxin-antitoxin system RelE/ParE family toxin [Sulfurimonas sp.]